MKMDYAELFKLSRAERIELVEDLWDSLADEPLEEVGEEKRNELIARRSKFRANPESGLSWDQVKARSTEVQEMRP
ncbi:addiction module protein [Luteolibacter arcticus]|uniref:Addiction module protein n=1 Tax=Luteolibacter arcticus TaxID=1581411 RepID=A0ABT3GG97_9BACT|nr:addiction module protein [Luteolibacter arcticus]MCW1922491.1 addiction module protein [Luteolibacter arcticus]